ncbi:uncharacterized protein LOC121636939 isoform X2 [Melanotaenia boesemani]|nr:uncharacterized protein LOC121636939 isoform X2 [Melanotaenia boesemani]
MIWPAALFLCQYLDTHRDQCSLVDKAVLEIGAGTGLVSVVAALLGGWVTATDLPQVLNNLRVNLCRNTRGHCRHAPQVAALSWGYDLEQTYPSSVYRYDYVLAADVVYHHDFLDELLATMKHFCKPGTTLIWANKVRFETDLTFTENFKKAFHTRLLAEDGEVKIFMATSREGQEEDDVREEIQDLLGQEKGGQIEEDEMSKAEQLKHIEADNCINQEHKSDMLGAERGDEEGEINDHDSNEEEEMEEMVDLREEICEEAETKESMGIASSHEDISGEELRKQKVMQQNWVPSVICSIGKDVYHYVGQDIVIYETIDSYGGVMWPAALALCSFLENNRQTVDLQEKEVLELGAGTGLVSIVASLLGASVTATDLPEMLGNLRANLMRNTRGRCRHTPQVAALSWGYDLEQTYPSSVYRYDYVLAADVVYHHDFLGELLATMKHFCKPGTTLIWANKVRFETDMTFTENFKKTFQTSLLVEDGEMKIFMATSREGQEEDDVREEIQDLLGQEKGGQIEEDEMSKAEQLKHIEADNCINQEHKSDMLGAERGDEEGEINYVYSDEEEEMEEMVDLREEICEEAETKESMGIASSHEDISGEELRKQKVMQQNWVPSVICSIGKDVYHYVGQDIVIHETIDSYGGMMWPAALALCYFLENNRQTVDLQEKEVLELRAGTGLVSIVASLLGASVTATDLPEMLGNLRANLMRNTRGRCRHTPQVAALSQGYDLEQTYPSSVYRYDYVLAADVVYHHDVKGELLATMKHFCKPGTTLIWANKVRFETDLTFTENFKKTFHTHLLVEDGEMKIFMATSREGQEEDDVREEIQDLMGQEKGGQIEEDEMSKAEQLKHIEADNCINQEHKSDMLGAERGDEEGEINDHDSNEEEEMEEMVDLREEICEEAETKESMVIAPSHEDISGEELRKQKVMQQKWVPSVICSNGKDVYHYVGQDIVIYETIDSYGGVMWPAALTLCYFLENNRQIVDLQEKEVLELGAGTGLVSIVASLLGASVTATDLPEMLGNLRANLMRNTRGRCRHTPQVAALSWGYDLEQTYPSSVYRYDYVLASDVVYCHGLMDELMATMKHFCKPGTTLIWANKVRFETDLTFIENLKKAFHTRLLAEDGEMKIFMATSR